MPTINQCLEDVDGREREFISGTRISLLLLIVQLKQASDCLRAFNDPGLVQWYPGAGETLVEKAEELVGKLLAKLEPPKS